jgi:hypothetical protein
MDLISGNLRKEAQSVISIASVSGRQVSQVRAVSNVNIVIICLDQAKLLYVYCAPSCSVALCLLCSEL